MAMAIYFRGMDDDETTFLARAMVDSGNRIDLSDLPGIKVDKHSTGGVGDTTTLVLAPLVAAAGVPVAKLSGHGLGHTGGTLDKLRAITCFRTELAVPEIKAAVKKIGVAIAAQTPDLVPADKKLYALRDVTATVDSMPLIAASIMSKKMAAGANALVLDVKVGDGAFVKEKERAFELARMMKSIGEKSNLRTAAVITSMDQPLGRAVGNSLEVEEAVMALRGEGPPDLEKLCLHLGGWMLYLAGKAGAPGEGEILLKKLLANGEALNKFKELLVNQSGDPKIIDDLSLLPQAEEKIQVTAAEEGYVGRIKAELVGRAAMNLGAGRQRKDSIINPAVGITLEKKIGDRVKKGDILALLYTVGSREKEPVASATAMIDEAYEIRKEPNEKIPLILGCVE